MQKIEETDTFLDRLEFGIISLFFGLVIGSIFALILSSWWVFYGFGIFFFILGVVRGVKAADIVAEAIGGLL